MTRTSECAGWVLVVVITGASAGGAACSSKSPPSTVKDAATEQGGGETGGMVGVAGRGGDGGGPGSAGAGGAAGAGGIDACTMINGLSRSCSTAADCVVVTHTSNCCGTARLLGLNSAELSRFNALEPTCRGAYPRCGCPTLQPMTDDGSTESRTSLTPPTQPSVACVAGTCTSYVTECGAPCPTGTVCFSCQTAGKRYAACTTECLDPKSNADCKNTALPLCQTGTTGNVAGNYCTASDIACDRK